MKITTLLYFLAVLLASMFACRSDTFSTDAASQPLFSLMPASETGIDFRNDLEYDRDFNIYRYRNFYNGGGVAIGDVNNDGLPDIYFTGNMQPNRLYLNRGNWKFEDVTLKAGVAGKGSWSTGVAMADINGDGLIDIYVCNSGNPRSDEMGDDHFSRTNECFINLGNKEGVPHFSEQAVALGIDDRGLSTHAAFFDYDRDGDLDLYMLNNSFRPIGSFDLRRSLRYERDSLGGHKLYRNDNGRFRDVSAQAGILGSVIAFGLGVTVGDLDMDGWQDIYVSNDFFERDYLYHNNGDGTFTEQLEKSMRHISAASMGADMADINNDAFPDIFVTDMLPEHDYRLKTTTSFDGPDRFQYTTSYGYYYQFTRNMLHLNNADGSFSDIACLGNMEATDWSWGALIFDMDNDGWKDVYVANGIAQDLTNQDYLMFASNPNVQQEIIGGGTVDFKRLIDSIPSEKIANYAFQNQGNLHFINRAAEWGLAQPSFSNGSAYGDLDNDGDLDLVVNNVNSEAFVYCNNASQLYPEKHYLKFELKGEAPNTLAFGTKIFVRAGNQTCYLEQMPMRGFQSAMDPRPNIGMGESTVADTVLVEWPNGRSTLLTAVKSNQTLRLSMVEANTAGWLSTTWLRPSGTPLLQAVTESIGTDWKHTENAFADWDRDRLLYFLYSTEGPRIARGDVNGDRLEDLFIGGASDQPGILLLQNGAGKFRESPQAAFAQDAACEDVDAAFFDADGDGDLDLYVASGSNEPGPLSPALTDRLYLNNGKGSFSRNPEALPGRKPYATACVRPADFDGDGDIDLFVGMRLLPGKVGVPVGGFLLGNDGKGYFSMQQPEAMKNLGMLTDAVWEDLDKDGDPDLVIVGEWMPVTILTNDKGRFTNQTQAYGLGESAGLWKRITAGDFNEDGHTDFVLGNMGLNSRLKATPKTPLTLFFNDFDQNGTPEQMLCRYASGELLPYLLRGDLISQMPTLKKKYLRFRNYAGQTMEDIFTAEQLADAIRLEAGILESAVLLSRPDGHTFDLQPLPAMAQFAPLFGLAVTDFNGDGHQDIACGGNFNGCKPEFGFMDADFGLLLLGNGKGAFSPLRSRDSGFRLDGEIRDMQLLRVAGQPMLSITRNNAAPAFYRLLVKSPESGRTGK